MADLTTDQRHYIGNVIFTLQHGLAKGWADNNASLDACIQVLEMAKEAGENDGKS